ncbi:MAG: OmpL47-type beta-barrel domain-containing protein [Thermoproteota archaeon]
MLSAEDTGSGIAETKYRIDEEPWNTYATGFNLSSYSDGLHSIEYYSIDVAGNNETVKALNIYLDKAPPVISNVFPTGSLTQESTSVSFTVNVEDANSGVKEVGPIIDGSSQGELTRNGNTYSKTIKGPLYSGWGTIGF